MLNPIQAIGVAWRNKFDFRGRARRSEYWWTVIFSAILLICIAFLDEFIFPSGISGDLDMNYVEKGWEGFFNDLKAYPIFNIVNFLLLLPLTFLAIRRLHDTGRKGWLAIICAFQDLFVSYLPTSAIFSIIYHVTENDLRDSYLDGFDTMDYFYILFFVSYFLLALWLFILCVLPSQKKRNRYGANSKNEGNFDIFN